MVRAGTDNELAGRLHKKGVVAIGWSDLGDLAPLNSRRALKTRYAEVYPEHSKHRRAGAAGQLLRFAHRMSAGDYVLTYLKAEREYLVGHIDGAYDYDTDVFEKDYPHVRPVDWIDRISRDAFSSPARNSLGSVLTVFSLDDYVDEIHALVTGEANEGEEAEAIEEKEEEAPPFFEDVKAQADELIADRMHHLDPYDFQDLVAAVLRAMGFQAVSTPPGPDRGIDIVAHPDALGFETPLIKAQVKHRQSTTGGPEMRSFIGTLRTGECGLFVSTGGFTRDAEQEAGRAHEPVTLLDRDAFIQLMLEHYEALESEYKAQIPLRRMWVPS